MASQTSQIKMTCETREFNIWLRLAFFAFLVVLFPCCFVVFLLRFVRTVAIAAGDKFFTFVEILTRGATNVRRKENVCVFVAAFLSNS